MSDSDEYIFDLTRAEYDDSFGASNNSQELWQKYAKGQLVNNLRAILKDAISYGNQRNQNKSETWLSHNAILVTSPRGSGKTVFLRNCQSMWQSREGSKADEFSDGDLLFLDVIDPTMLMAQDSFANVIVAQIYQVVSKKLDESNCCNDEGREQRDKFHRRLRKLADAMGKTSEFNGASGIDKILKYSSGIQLENYFHLFVESAISILGCKAIAVSIDDVDMAMERAFEVVDDVRRFLGCPYLIPIVSGELKLYEHMTQKHFDDKAYENLCRDSELKREGKNISKELTKAYLTKVFPSPMRITLFSIERLLNRMQLKYGDKKQVSYLDYQEHVLNQFYFLCHNRDARRNWTPPKSARELTQLVRAIPPQYLTGLESVSNISSYSGEKEDDGYKEQLIQKYSNYKNWALQQENGEALSLAESAITLLHDNGGLFDIRKLLAFDLLGQTDANLYPWAEYNVLAEQLERLNELHKQGGDKINNKKLLEDVLNHTERNNRNCLKSMPPLEPLIDKLYITQGVAKYYIKRLKTKEVDEKELLKSANKMGWKVDWKVEEEEKIPIKYYNPGEVVLDLYTESSVYSTLNNNFKFAFFSRAFEILAYSLLIDNEEKSLLIDVYYILQRKPFYSLLSLAETKIALEGESDEDSREELDLTVQTSALVLSVKIKEWRQEYRELFEKLRPEKLLPLLSYCFNGAFTALHVIKGNCSNEKGGSRQKNKNFTDEHLSDTVLRFKYNVLNAIYRSGIRGEAVYANVLVGAKSKTVRDKEQLKKYERTYSRNKKIIEEELEITRAESCKGNDPYDTGEKSVNVEMVRAKKSCEKLNLIRKLHDAVAKHPIFTIFPEDEKLFILGEINNPIVNETIVVNKLGAIVKEVNSNSAIYTMLEKVGNILPNDNLNKERVKTLATILSKHISGNTSKQATFLSSIKKLLEEGSPLTAAEIERLRTSLLKVQRELEAMGESFLNSKEFEKLDEKLQNLIKAILNLDLGNDKG
ncbi:hypothetical protein [Pseudoalteromonas sp. NC201]|uniref:hypothetical protein n=1 Tax=Pseudoalteromonas sp. NC201 TaxID=1514074 RepID=UPI000C7A4813|nr:hypothetical protein [Pseudoalteromonas sp. NC201]AUJ69180.1 hypothetical protein PNC201_04300 [Pseudoalteromonas sp. NC201]